MPLLLAGPAFALGPVLPDYLPSDTKVVIGVNLRRILDSPMGKELAAKAVKLAPQTLADIDFLKDVDELLIATNAVGQNPSGLLVMKGRFKGPAVLTDPKNPNATFAILDETSAIAGESALVNAAIASRGKGATFPAIETRIAPLLNRYDVWGAGRVESGEEFSFGAALQQGLDLMAEIRMSSASEMAKLMETIKPFQAMLKAQTGASKFNFQTQGRTLKVSVSIPEEELKKAIVTQKAALTDTLMRQFAAMTPAAAPVPPPKPPRTEGQILKDSRGDTLRVMLPGGR